MFTVRMGAETYQFNAGEFFTQGGTCFLVLQGPSAGLLHTQMSQCSQPYIPVTVSLGFWSAVSCTANRDSLRFLDDITIAQSRGQPTATYYSSLRQSMLAEVFSIARNPTKGAIVFFQISRGDLA